MSGFCYSFCLFFSSFCFFFSVTHIRVKTLKRRQRENTQVLNNLAKLSQTSIFRLVCHKTLGKNHFKNLVILFGYTCATHPPALTTRLSPLPSFPHLPCALQPTITDFRQATQLLRENLHTINRLACAGVFLRPRHTKQVSDEAAPSTSNGS